MKPLLRGKSTTDHFRRKSAPNDDPQRNGSLVFDVGELDEIDVFAGAVLGDFQQVYNAGEARLSSKGGCYVAEFDLPD